MTQSSDKEPLKVLTSQDGDVIAIAGSSYTDQEIAADREDVVQRLHTSYMNLLDSMEEFQQQWDDSPTHAFLDAAYEGLKVGGADWGASFTDLFDKETWKQVGDKVEGFAGQAYDALATYSEQQYEELREAFEDGSELVDNANDTIKSWAWWRRVIDDGVKQARDYGQQKIEAATKSVDDASATMLDSTVRAAKLYQHREAILNLPNLISKGDAVGVQRFVDTVLMDVDPALAKSIKKSGQFHIALELIADHDSALNYMSYLSLMVEAVPPNFYAYVSAKYGVQLLLEVILLLACALFTAGTGVAVRLSTLAARLLATSAKTSGAVRRIRKAQLAIQGFVRSLDDFMDAARGLQRLGEKLVSARARGVTMRGSTRTTLTAKKQIIKRDTKCRLCGSTEHTTPRGRLGMVVYD